MAWSCYKQQDLLEATSIELLRECFEDICRSKEVKILSANIVSNYVYLVLDCKPKHIIPDLLKSLKGASARYLIKNDTHISTNAKDGVWDGMNIIGTDESVLEEVQKYIDLKK